MEEAPPGIDFEEAKRILTVLEREGVRYVRRTPLDPDNLRLACALSQLAYWLHPMKHIPGVRKYRSVEEAWQARKEWVRSQLRRPAAPTE
jgi:hypothetical protein